MADHGIPLLVAIALWWAGTAAILMLAALPGRTVRLSMGAMSVVLAGGLYGIAVSAGDDSLAGAYVAFFSAIAVWGWIEASFLLGLVTGPRRATCPPDAGPWDRFRLATGTLLYHELAILAGAVSLVALTWQAPNLTGLYAFLILAGMRLSAKLNIFLGVPNINEEFVPARLAYLTTYFRRGPASVFFPLSVVAAGFVAAVLFKLALHAPPGSADGAGFALLFGLMALAILEHIFMVMPLGDAALWRWALPAEGSRAKDEAGS